MQTFEELAGRHVPSGAAVESVLVDACLSTIGGGGSSQGRQSDRSVFRPSPVQAECWGAVLGGGAGDLVTTSYTGSGKTLAFLLPMFAGGSLAAVDTGMVRDPVDADEQQELVKPQGLVLAPKGAPAVRSASFFCRPQGLLSSLPKGGAGRKVSFLVRRKV